MKCVVLVVTCRKQTNKRTYAAHSPTSRTSYGRTRRGQKYRLPDERNCAHISGGSGRVVFASPQDRHICTEMHTRADTETYFALRTMLLCGNVHHRTSTRCRHVLLPLHQPHIHSYACDSVAPTTVTQHTTKGNACCCLVTEACG